jgi:outer membrane receptor protein involved in Fe transport
MLVSTDGLPTLRPRGLRSCLTAFLQLGLLLSLVLAAPPLHAQIISGDLVVSVSDPDDLVMSGATLLLTDVETGVTHSAATRGDGTYLFGQLKPGLYKLEVSAQGFNTTNVQDIRIQVGQRARVEVKLQVAVTEAITISAAATTLLNAESAAIGQVIDSKTMVELPLNGRNFIQLAQLSAGATPLGIGTSPASNWTGRSDTTLSIAGGRESNNSFLVNGIETRNARFGNAGMRPSIDAIQEFKIQRSTFGAEFGRSAAVVNTTIKSGTNQLRGSIFEFHRDERFDATDFFLNRTGREKAPFRQNNFGTAIGGPLVIPSIYNGQNRSFWFFAYEGFRQESTSSATGLYPSEAQLLGNLADDSTGTGLYPTSSGFCQANPGSRKCVDVLDPSTGMPFPGNVIPRERLDPITQLATRYTVLPNVAVPTGTGQFPTFNAIGTPATINDFDQYNLRLDHQLGPRDQLYGTYSWADETRDVKVLRQFGGEGFPLSNRLVTITHAHTFSPTLLNEFRFGYNRSRTYRLSETSFGPDYAREVFNLRNTTDQAIMFGIPAFNMNGFGGIGSISQAIGALDENLQFTDNLSLVKGSHNVRAGFQISRQRYFQITNFNGNPTFTFDGRYTGLQAAGIGLADFLLGYPSRAGGAIGDSIQNLRTTYWGAYVQDDWRIRPNLTLNYGLRYEFARSPVERDNKSLVFAPDQGRILLAGDGVRPDIVDPDWNNFAPRLGFTWQPGVLSDFVVRGGAGIYYSTDNFNEEQFKGSGPPFFQAQTIEGNPRTPDLFMRDMMPSFTNSPNVNPFTFDRGNRTPYLTQWSVGAQKSFSNDFLLEAEYTGSEGSKLPQRRNLNIATLDPTGTTPIVQRVPFPQFGPILMTYNGGWSSYHALTAKVEKRWSKGLWFLGSYTWQRSLDLGATDEFSALSREFKVWDKGYNTYHVPHRFVGSWAYELPVGRGRALLSEIPAVVDAFLGGWQVSGIVTFSEGQYQTVTLGTDWLFIGSFTQSRPNIIGDPTANRSFPDAYLDPAAFDFPKDAQGNRIRVQGDAGRNTIQQPGINNWDIGLFKNFRVRDRVNVQFRWETFNTWNHTQFGSANVNMSNPAFGRITSLRVPPRRMQFGLRVTF